MKMNIQESFVGKTLNRKTSDIVPKKLELDEQSFFSLLSEYTDSLGIITNLSNGDIVDTKSESGREFPVIVKKEVKRYLFKPVSGLVLGDCFIVSLVVSPYSYFWGKATEIPVFDLDFKVLFYPNNNEIRIGIYVNDYKAKCCRKNGVSYEVVPRHFFRKSDGRFLDKSHDFYSRPQKFFELTKMGVDSDTLGICKNYIKRIADFKVEPEKGVGVLNLSNDSLEDSIIKVQSIFGDELFCLEEKVLESFTKKVSRKNSSDLISDIDYPDGVYILHDTLGVKTVDGWNPRNNYGVVGILVVEGEHKIVVALEDSPKNLLWSKKWGKVNQPVDEFEEAESDFNGEMYCRKLNSPDYPAAYYCKTYNKGNRSWYLPSLGELWLIYNHLEEIQTALSIVGGQKFVTSWDIKDIPVYWSSTELSATNAYPLYFDGNQLLYWRGKVSNSGKVRPVSKFDFSTLKESFTRKIRSKKNDELISKPAFEIPDGVYILHETLGVKGVEGWKPKNNDGVVGVLVVEDEHKIVVATEDAPENLTWSKKRGLINQPIVELEDAESDFNGEYYCRKLDSPDFPAAYYCKTYNKGGRSWYLPSSGELWMIYHHLEEIQTALSIVGGQKFDTNWNEGVPLYWSSTEDCSVSAWNLNLIDGGISCVYNKVGYSNKVRPVSNFSQNRNLKESFTKKIKSTRKSDLNSKPSFVLDNGVYVLHETLGVKTVDGWNPKNNKGVVGILLIEDDHKIVVALKDSPKNLCWSKKRKMVNQPFDESEESDFNGEYYCQKLDSPDFPAAYYCKTYNKGGRNWHLPSSGELWLIYQHLEEIQNALSIVRGQRFVTVRGEDTPVYWSSTEDSAMHAWAMGIGSIGWCNKIGDRYKVRPVSNFNLSELKESFVKKTRKSNSKEIVQDADDKAFNPVMDAKEFVGRMKECILSYKQPYVYGKKNPYNLEKFSFEMITSWPNTFKFNDVYSNELLFDVSNSKKRSFRIKLIFFKDNSKNIICYLTVGPIFNIFDERLFQYIYDSKKKRISFVENPKGVRFDDKVESIEPTLKNLNFILNDIRFLMDNWKILYKTYLKKDSFETWNEFYKMLPSQNNKGFDFDLKESFVHKTAKKGSDSFINKKVFGNMESFEEFDKLFKKFLKEHEHQFSKCTTTKYPLKFISGRISYKISLKKDCPFEDGSNDSTALEFSLDVFQGDIMNFTDHQDLNTPHGILTVAFYTELGPSTPQHIDLKNLEFIGNGESPEDFRFDKFKERREWERPNFSYQLLFGLERFLMALVETVNNMDEQTWTEIGKTSANFKPFKGEACCGADGKIILDILDNHGFYSELHRNFSKVNLAELNESFTKKIKNRSSKDLTDNQSFQLENGLYILHETLGVRTVDGWNPKDNEDVVGILLVEDDHQIVIALEDSPKNLHWSKKNKLVNASIGNYKDADSDFNGEMYCRKLDSPDFPAAYYCKTYNKGGRNWYLPSTGELWLIYNHLEEIQNALSIVGGQKLITTWDECEPVYLSSTERSATGAWGLYLNVVPLYGWPHKVSGSGNVRPVSKFDFSTLKESFTRKIRSKKNDELISKSDAAFVPDGVYILHDTLGLKGVEGWNPRNNYGVVGILVVEDDYKIVVALEDSPKNLLWSKKCGLINQPVDVDELEDAESDFNGEYYCQKLDSPNYPAAYYCKTYNKGNRDWYLPSSGELWLIYNHLEEIQNALETVGGQKLVTIWDDDVPVYLSSTESSVAGAWALDIYDVYLDNGYGKVSDSGKVRPVSKFNFSTLKESFTRKISRKKNDELISKSDAAFEIPDGVYILHETLGVRTVDGWNPKDNKGVVGILLVEYDYKIVVALENSPKMLRWSTKYELINESIEEDEDVESDFNGENHCINLNSPDFPAAYYCLNYKKGGRNWHLPSSGELWLIYNHLEEIQTALKTVGGQKFATSWDEGYPIYWSSTELDNSDAWELDLSNDTLLWYNKVEVLFNVRPVSKFGPSKTLKESFTHKIRSKKNDELISKSDTAFEIPDGVYILHETLGVRTVDSWNPKNNDGVVGILLIEDEHKIVVALEDSPNNLTWSSEYGLINQPVDFDELENAEPDFNGEYYCQRLDSPNYPAAYYCKTYNKGNRNWYLPSTGELWLIYNHLEEIQNALSIVGGQKFVTTWDEDVPVYWSSTEDSATNAWYLNTYNVYLDNGCNKVSDSAKVRPVSNFSQNRNLKESFTRKISRKKNDELISKSDTAFLDGVYILHETLGIKTVDGWNPEDNEGVVGILLIEDDHKIVVATKDAPEDLPWSEKRKLVNEPIEEEGDAASDFNGEKHCINLNSPDFPAAYYCKTYNKGGRKWYLPSSGELWMIYNHFEEIQNALSIVGGQKFITKNNDGLPAYWSSTEGNSTHTWFLSLEMGCLDGWFKDYFLKVRPVSNFSQNRNLKESFTKKTTTKGRNEIIGQADNLVVDYENIIKGLIKKYGFSTIHKYVLSLSRGVGYKKPPYVRRHEPFTEDKMVTILGEMEFDKSETSDNDITVTWRRAKKFHYRTPIEKTEKFSELSVDEKRDIYKYLINWLNVRIDEDEKIEKMDKLPQPSRNVV